MATSELTLETDTEVFKGDRVVADGVERELGDVTTAEVAGLLVSNTDPFGDGSLVATYQLDGGATDLSGNYNGTATNVTYGTGKFGQAAVFTGASNSNITISSTLGDTYLAGSKDFTISFWVSITSNGGTIASFGDYVNGWFGANCSNTNSYIHFGNGSNIHYWSTQFSSSMALVTVTNEVGVGSKFYKNGVYDGANANFTIASGYSGILGGSSAGTTVSIDQVRIFNKALTQTEVTTLYTEEATKYSADFNTPLASIPTSVYRLDHDNLTIDGTPDATTATVLDSRTGLIASGDTVLLDGVGVVCNPVVEGTVPVTVANDEFETVLYTGNGSTQTITMANITGGVDFIWNKVRNQTYNHCITDSIRGLNLLSSDTTGAEIGTNNLNAFGDSSFSVSYGTNNGKYNENAKTYVAWCASLPNHTPSNTDGTITSETKSNSFMSAVSYTGNGVASTVGHGLGVIPELIIHKRRGGATAWAVYNSTIGAGSALQLNSTAAAAINSGYFNNTTPSSSVFTLGDSSTTNSSVDNHIAYAFASVAGKCKVGSYTGTGAAGNAVDCGFEPAWLLTKDADDPSSWVISDIARGEDNHITANLSAAEHNHNQFDFTPTGFTTVDSWENVSGNTYIYLAIAKDVDKTTPKYDLTYPTQTAPTRIALSNNDIVPTVASDTFDGTDTFTKTYNKVTKTARDVEYGFVADTDIEIVQLNLNQNMEP